MKIYSVLATFSYQDKDLVTDSTVFPRAFKSVEEAKHAIDEDRLEVWGELAYDPESPAPDLDSTDAKNFSIEISEDSSYSWEIIEQDFE